MKKLLMVLGLFLLAAASTPAWAQTRIGTVDLRKVFDSYWKTKQADAALKERAAEMEKQYKDLVDDYKKGRQAYQTMLAEANNQVLAAEERDKRKKAAEDKLKQIKDAEDTITQFERTAKTTIDEQRKRMITKLVEEIQNVLNAKAKAAGYTLVIDTSADSSTATPIVLYTDRQSDLTDTLLAQLNAAAPPDAAPKAELKDKPTGR